MFKTAISKKTRFVFKMLNFAFMKVKSKLNNKVDERQFKSYIYDKIVLEI